MNILKVTDCNRQIQKSRIIIQKGYGLLMVNEESEVSEEKLFYVKMSFIKLSYSTYTFSY